MAAVAVPVAAAVSRSQTPVRERQTTAPSAHLPPQRLLLAVYLELHQLAVHRTPAPVNLVPKITPQGPLLHQLEDYLAVVRARPSLLLVVLAHLARRLLLLVVDYLVGLLPHLPVLHQQL
jgi:hypothetical protein